VPVKAICDHHFRLRQEIQASVESSCYTVLENVNIISFISLFLTLSVSLSLISGECIFSI
jgi:hypothetical protein